MQVAFSQRPASAQWEAVAIPRIPGLNLWAWFRPQHLPTGVSVTIPPEVAGAYPSGLPFTVQDLLQAVGTEPSGFQGVSLYGGQMQSAATFLPYLNHPVPSPVPGMPAEITLMLASPDFAPGEPVPAADAGADSSQMYQRIESSWKSAIQMERQMVGLRQKLAGLVNALGKLDRELTPEERLCADREDRDSWEEARRWCRELGGKCHREIKQFDIGMTSAAGRRNWMEQQFDEIIEPRAPVGDLENVRREFESYRKDMSNLLRAMTNAIQTASQNGSQRSQRVLNVIGRKIRERRAKMREPIGGVNMDKSCRRKR